MKSGCSGSSSSPGAAPAPDPVPGFRRVARETFPALLGLWLALALLKLGHPVILDTTIPTPSSLLDWIYQPWPTAFGYAGAAALVALAIVGRPALPARPAREWLAALLLGWLAWQAAAAAAASPGPGDALIRATLPHFACCAVAWTLGRIAFAPNSPFPLRSFWLGLAGGWLTVTAIGWRQHFGGLADLREYVRSLPDWQHSPPELLAKIASDRIYSTLVYPNALAGVLLLLTPPIAAAVWTATATRPAAQRLGLTLATVFSAIACLVWSGSKAGWLIALAILAAVPLTQRRLGPRVWLSAAVLLAIGLGGFWLRYQDYFERGATSVAARTDYWKAAWANASAHPWLGSGPGTFLQAYRRLKPPEAEMTRLAHNDYLQQATDSGWIGCALFTSLIAGTLWITRPQRRPQDHRQSLNQSEPLPAPAPAHPPQTLHTGVWLGVLGISLQSLVEFGLYIPAIAWPWFLALGGLVAASPPRDRTSTPATPNHSLDSKAPDSSRPRPRTAPSTE